MPARARSWPVFQLAEVAVPRALFAAILRRIDRPRGPPVAADLREERTMMWSARGENHAPKIGKDRRKPPSTTAERSRIAHAARNCTSGGPSG